jgi:hypothetical protein
MPSTGTLSSSAATNGSQIFKRVTRVSATIYELHSGPPLVTFPVTVHELTPGDLAMGLFADVVGHRQLTTAYAEAKSSSRMLALQT